MATSTGGTGELGLAMGIVPPSTRQQKAVRPKWGQWRVSPQDGRSLPFEEQDIPQQPVSLNIALPNSSSAPINALVRTQSAPPAKYYDYARSFHRSSSKYDRGRNTILAELKELRSDIKQLSSRFEHLEKYSASSESDITHLSSKVEQLEKNTGSSQSDIIQLSSKVEQLEKNTGSSQSDIIQLSSKVEQLEKYTGLSQSTVVVVPQGLAHSNKEKNRNHLRALTLEQVQLMLDKTSLAQYKGIFARKQITGDVLSELSEEELQTKLGITSHIHRMRLMTIISGQVHPGSLQPAEGIYRSELADRDDVTNQPRYMHLQPMYGHHFQTLPIPHRHHSLQPDMRLLDRERLMTSPTYMQSMDSRPEHQTPLVPYHLNLQPDMMMPDIYQRHRPPEIHLSIGDVWGVFMDLRVIAPAKWYDLGLELGVPVALLNTIRSEWSPHDCAREVLLEWLKGKGRLPTTWETLVQVLKSRTVSEPRLAERLRTKYCLPTGSREKKQFALSPSFQELPGVQFISKTTIRVHGSEDLQTFQWESCGFRMHVPSGALAKSVQCDVTIATSLSGSFEQPQETTPVSAVYYIESSKEFSKPIMLELEHCCHFGKYSECLTFAVANTAARRPPYRFQLLQSGNFQSTSSYGCIEVLTFSLFEILLKKFRRERTIVYYGYLYCKQQSRCKWTVVLVISRKLTACLQAVKHHYHNWHKVTEFTVHFSDGSDSVSLDIPPEGIERDNGCWKIRPKFTPKIRKQDIDGFRPDVEGPASCELTVTWLKEDDYPKDLEYCITLSGLQQPDYVLLEVSVNPLPSPATASSTCFSGIELNEMPPSLLELLKFPGEKEKFSIPERIGTNYSDFGIHLLEDETGDAVDGVVEENRGNAKNINFAILKKWIKGKGRQPVTWRTLIEVLRDADLTVLANDIETVKCQSIP